MQRAITLDQTANKKARTGQGPWSFTGYIFETFTGIRIKIAAIGHLTDGGEQVVLFYLL